MGRVACLVTFLCCETGINTDVEAASVSIRARGCGLAVPKPGNKPSAVSSAPSANDTTPRSAGNCFNDATPTRIRMGVADEVAGSASWGSVCAENPDGRTINGEWIVSVPAGSNGKCGGTICLDRGDAFPDANPDGGGHDTVEMEQGPIAGGQGTVAMGRGPPGGGQGTVEIERVPPAGGDGTVETERGSLAGGHGTVETERGSLAGGHGTFRIEHGSPAGGHGTEENGDGPDSGKTCPGSKKTCPGSVESCPDWETEGDDWGRTCTGSENTCTGPEKLGECCGE